MNNFSVDEIHAIALAMSLKLNVHVDQIKLSVKDGLFTLTINGQTKSGTLDEVWTWVNDLAAELDRSNDFEP